MAQYNLLGGVNPINPQYDIQNSMRGKGTNWAEYGLRKEQLKEQKKQNRINNVMQGINTAMNLVNTGLEFKNNELKRESQELINTERALDIQSKRIDINNKQKEADEDAKFADGIMSLLEAKDYEKVGAYIYGTNPKILQRNEGITWSAIQSARDQFGDAAANKLLSYALPQRAQEMLKEQYANRRADLAYKGQIASANSRIKSAEISAQSRIDAAKIKQETDLLKSQNDMLTSFLGIDNNFGGTTAKPGVVNQTKADMANAYSNAIENLNPTLQSNDPLYNFFNSIGVKNEKGGFFYSLIDQENNVLNPQAISDFYANGNKFQLLNIKEYWDNLQKAIPPEILQQFIASGRLPLNPKVLKNMSGEDIKNILTNDSLVSTFFLPNSELFIPMIQSFLQEENKPIGVKAKDSLFGSNENPNDSASILLAFDSMGNSLDATPISQDDADNVRTLIKGAVAQNAYRQQAKRDAINMQNRLVNFTKFTGISTQRQRAALDARIEGLNSPRLNFKSNTREAEKQQLLNRVYSMYLEDGPEAALNEMMNLYGLNSINDLTAKKVNLLLGYTKSADKAYTDKDLSEMDEAEKTALYEELRAATSNKLAKIAQEYYETQTNKSNTNVLSKIDKSVNSRVADAIKTSLSDATTPINTNKTRLENESFGGKLKNKVASIFTLGLDKDAIKEFEKYIGKDREKKLEKAFSKLSDRQEEEAKTKLNKVISTFNKEFNTKFNPIEFWWLFSDDGQLAFHINNIIRNIKDDPKKVQRFNELIDKYLLDKKPVINKKAIQTDVPSGNTNIG